MPARPLQPVPVAIPGLAVLSLGSATAIPIGISADRSTLFGAGGSNNSTLYQSADDGATWTVVKAFTGTASLESCVETDDGEAVVVQHGSSNGTVQKSTGWAASKTAATWTAALTTPSNYLRGYWGGGHFCSYGNNTVLAGSGKYGILNEYGTQTPNGYTPGATAYATRAYFTSNYGATWTEVLNLQDRYPTIAPLHLHASAYDPWWDRLWVTYGDTNAEGSGKLGLLYSDDHGATWTAAANATEWTDYLQSTTIGVFKDYILLGSDNAPGMIRLNRQGYRQAGPPQVVEVTAPNTGAQMIANGMHRNRKQVGAPMFATIQTQSDGRGPAAIYASVDEGTTFAEVWRDPMVGGVRGITFTTVFGPTANGVIVAGATGLLLRGQLTPTETGMFDGTALFTGDGTTTVFTATHDASGTPTRLRGWSVNAVGGSFSTTANATNLTFTFAAAPANGAKVAVAYRYGA